GPIVAVAAIAASGPAIMLAAQEVEESVHRSIRDAHRKAAERLQMIEAQDQVVEIAVVTPRGEGAGDTLDPFALHLTAGKLELVDANLFVNRDILGPDPGSLDH